MPKLDQQQFDDLIARVRAGDQSAATELVKVYEPEIRRDVRLRLANSQLRRTLDSTDICQSIFGNFFVRATLGQFDFERPEALLGLLARMAKNKLIDRQRRETAQQPNGSAKMVYGEIAGELHPKSPTQSPSSEVAANDLQARIESSLSEDELKIAKMRRDGFSWDEISEEFGETTDALRKRLTRAGDRILSELDLDA